MSAEISKAQETLLHYFEQAIELSEKWIVRFQEDPVYQSAFLAFLVGLAFGWILRSLFSPAVPKRIPPPSSGDALTYTKSGKTKEEVELDARRRL